MDLLGRAKVTQAAPRRGANCQNPTPVPNLARSAFHDAKHRYARDALVPETSGSRSAPTKDKRDNRLLRRRPLNGGRIVKWTWPSSSHARLDA